MFSGLVTGCELEARDAGILIIQLTVTNAPIAASIATAGQALTVCLLSLIVILISF